MAGFGVEINKADLDEVKRTLRGVKNGYENVVRRSLNKTLTGVRTDSVKEIRKNFVSGHKVLAKTLRPGFKLKKASQANLTAAVRNEGVLTKAILFNTKKTDKGVIVKVSNDAQEKMYYGAFIATIKGHEGVFQRKRPPYKTSRSPHLAWKKFAKDKKKYFRLPVKEVYIPFISPHTMAKITVMNPILKQAGERLHKVIFQELNYELSKLK